MRGLVAAARPRLLAARSGGRPAECEDARLNWRVLLRMVQRFGLTACCVATPRVLGVAVAAAAIIVFTRSGADAQWRLLPPRVLPVADARIDRVEQWLTAAESHHIGVRDEPLESISAWTNDDLDALLLDLTSVGLLVTNPRGARFTIPSAANRPTELGYTPR